MTKMRPDFIAVILTHGRADNVMTLWALRTAGYTGNLALIVDSGDKHLDEYINRYGESVWVFEKPEWVGRVDDGDNSGDHRAVIYARNASIEIARERGFNWILQLDDDYTAFNYKTDSQLRYKTTRIKNLNAIWGYMLEYAEAAKIACFAMSQEGDHIGGPNSIYNKTIRTKRKAMNSMFINVHDPVEFVGKVNEDATMATMESLRGRIVLTTMFLSLSQGVTQQNPGGLTGIYRDQGTYIKSMYSVLYAPSAVKVKNMVVGEKRLHHIVDYSRCCPCIIREQHRKPREERLA